MRPGLLFKNLQRSATASFPHLRHPLVDRRSPISTLVRADNPSKGVTSGQRAFVTRASCVQLADEPRAISSDLKRTPSPQAYNFASKYHGVWHPSPPTYVAMPDLKYF